MAELFGWIPDIGAEEAMTRLGIAWKVERVCMTDIDVPASRKNHARKEKLDKEHAESIAASQRRGDSMPMIVVRNRAGLAKPKIIAGGHHRHHGFDANGVDEITAYVVECTDSEFVILCNVLNTSVGKGMTKAEKVEKAADAVMSQMMTTRQAAIHFGVDVSSVNARKRSSEAGSRLLARTGKTLRLPQVTAVALADIQADSVFREALELAESSKSPSKEVAKAIQMAGELPEAEAIKAIRSFRIEEEANQRSVSSPKRTQFLRSLTMVSQLASENKTLDALEIPKEMQKEVREKCKTIANFMNSL